MLMGRKVPSHWGMLAHRKTSTPAACISSSLSAVHIGDVESPFSHPTICTGIHSSSEFQKHLKETWRRKRSVTKTTLDFLFTCPFVQHAWGGSTPLQKLKNNFKTHLRVLLAKQWFKEREESLQASTELQKTMNASPGICTAEMWGGTILWSHPCCSKLFLEWV